MMDLEDSFIEKLLERKKARKETMIEKKQDTIPVGKKRAALVEEQQVNSGYPPEESPKRHCTDAVQSTCSDNDKENVEMHDESADAEFVPYHSASKVRGLAALKKKNVDDDDDGNINTTPGQQVNARNMYIYSTNSSDLVCSKQTQKSRLANLAANIRQWEDDTHKPTLSSKNVTSNNTAKFQMPQTNTPNSASKASFSMKLYYTNKPSSNITNSAKHEEISHGSSYPSSSFGKGGLKTVSAHKEGNIEVRSVGNKMGKLQAWDQAVTAALETPTVVKSPLKTGSGSSNKQVNLQSALDSESEEYSDDEECINEFTENYNDIKCDGSNKMDFDCTPIKPATVQEKVVEPMKCTTFEKSLSPVVQKPINQNVDPAELPLAARKALFEKALLCGSPKINDVDVVNRNLSVAQRAAMFEKASKAESAAKCVQTFKQPKRIAFSDFSKFEKKEDDEASKSPVKASKAVTIAVSKISKFEKKNDDDDVPKSPLKALKSAPKKDPQEIIASPVKRLLQPVAVTPSPPKNVGNHTRLIQQKLMESTGSNWQEKQAAKAAEERKQEISGLVNHWEKLSSSSSVETNSETNRAHLASQERFSCESDDSAEVSESEKETDHYADNEVSANDSDCMDGDDENDYNEGSEQNNDNYLDEKTETEENVFYLSQEKKAILEPVKENYSHENHSDVASVSSHGTRSILSSLSYCSTSSNADDNSYNASNIRSCSSGSSARSIDIVKSAVEKPLQEKRESKNPEIYVVRTLSAYRREKEETKLTPVRTVVRHEKVSSPESPPDTDYAKVIEENLKELQNEILKQQTIISQTSQALNLCIATAEFSGSMEQVEAERHLLIATQKRQACLNEMTRLKTCAAQGENIAKGSASLIISNLQLPLKREFIASQLEGRGNDAVHYFLCLIRHGAQVIVTDMMSTDEKSSDGILNFTNHIQLKDLASNFSVVFEVYALQTKKEVLNHEQKYHIKRETSKKRLTPLKGKKCDGKIPAVYSPGGPNAVRSPSFGVVGFTRFTLQNCSKKTFTLDKVPFTSPLEGVLRVHLQLHAEYKVELRGFLTFYEDVGDMGALFRRWCYLDGDHIAYWKYPEDEHKKKPIGSIDLRQCITPEVKLVSSLECARPHTFKLITIRPQKEGDRNTLITRTVDTLTKITYLLTADTKDERILWCNKINDALKNVRLWDPQTVFPVKGLQI